MSMVISALAVPAREASTALASRVWRIFMADSSGKGGWDNTAILIGKYFINVTVGALFSGMRETRFPAIKASQCHG